MTQMTSKDEVRKHGECVLHALLKEYTQLHNKKVFIPLDEKILSYQGKRYSLYAIDLIKEKHCGQLKGHTCADGRKQRASIRKEDDASPTISLEALMLYLMIDGVIKRDLYCWCISKSQNGRFCYSKFDKDRQ